MTYRKLYSTRKTPQREPVPGREQVENSAGGYVFSVGDWKRLERWLILGSSTNTYYASARKLTRENADCVLRCLKEDGTRTVKKIVEISDAGRAPKSDPALFALAMCASLGDDETRRLALSSLSRVARTGYHLFVFAEYIEGFRGWGRGLRNAVGSWYQDKGVDCLAYQTIKYRQRGGWSHRDLLRLSHPKPVSAEHKAIYGWITQGEDNELLPSLIRGFEQAQKAETEKEIIGLIGEYRLPWEAIPTEFLKSANVWGTLLPNLPMTATIRNLGRMTANGLIVPLSNAVETVVDKLSNMDVLRKARVHPIAILSALGVYSQGHGARGKLTWSPVQQIVDVLNDAFYGTFELVEPTNKRLVLAVDVSGSMFGGEIAGVPGLSPARAAAAMALVTANVESNYTIVGFSHQMVPLRISPKQRIDDVERAINDMPMGGGTDCALPMMWALGHDTTNTRWQQEYTKVRDTKINTDGFLIYTDNETWFGSIHPFQALQKYRRETGINAKLITVAMTATDFTIADPDDSGMLDCVGFDTRTPSLISDFIKE